jgi:membrane protein implicated in regulation of membrane protease activity
LSNNSSRIKSIGNTVGWLISVFSGLFTLMEVLAPKGTTALSNLGLIEDYGHLLFLLEIWYVKYAIMAIFVGLLLFFVFPREKEQVKKRRRTKKAATRKSN